MRFILIKIINSVNLAESFIESLVKNFIIFYFNLVIRDYLNSTDQDSYNIIKLFSSLF